MFRIPSLSVMLVNNYYKAWESYIRHLNDLINYSYKKNLKVSYNSYISYNVISLACAPPFYPSIMNLFKFLLSNIFKYSWNININNYHNKSSKFPYLPNLLAILPWIGRIILEYTKLWLMGHKLNSITI